ncbi:hypothetical protein TruAng_008355 [Truncatella angustata]|nr:hypothetical protein TruAng_008355 [Truncatella angustata]
MAEESKVVDPKLTAGEEDLNDKGKGKAVAVESADEGDDLATEADAATSTGAKKKKSKKKKLKDALTGKSSKDDQETNLHKAIDNLTPDQVSQLLDLNPALASEIARTSGSNDLSSATEALKRLKLQEIMTGLASSGKNAKDMGAYKFWSTQPVTHFGEEAKFEDGPIKIQTIDQVSKEPPPLIQGFEWCDMDISNPTENEEVRDLLQGHYVEDDEALFRFNYSYSILKW